MTSQLSLGDFDQTLDLEVLTDAEREAYVAVEQDGVGVRELARQTDWKPGTVGNLLRRVRDKLDEEGSR